VDGELVSLIPPIPVSFPAGVQGTLLTLHVGMGQRVRKGDLIATLDSAELEEALQDARRAAERARLRREAVEKQAQARRAEEAQAAAEAARAATERAAEAYQRAQWEQERRWHAVQVAEKQSPAVAIARAEANLAKARAAKDPLAEDIKIAELALLDAQTAAAIHELNLAALRQEAYRARVTAEGLKPPEADATGADGQDTPQSEPEPESPELLALRWAEADALRAEQEAQARLALAELRAPRDGLVVAVRTAEGATVHVETPIVTLLNTSDLRFLAQDLQERQAAALRPGQKARIVLRFYPQTLVQAEVEVLVPGTSSSGARFEAYLTLTDRAGLALLPGMTGRAEIDVGHEN
jgi:multidrug resistance efflux pump